MKKLLLVMLLSMVLVIAMATSAFAFTDTDDLSTVEQDAIYRLYALGILNGYPDGTFGADGQITRAEFAKIACIVAGYGDVSDVLQNTPSSFTDVAVGMWYTGYVNVAASQGYIHGYPDGTFRPNDPITMAEVVTILMRIAGYNDNLPGPWPFDYVAEAGKEDVTDDVTFVSTAASTRADVAVMVNNLLDVELVNYDNDLSDFVDDEDEGTVLESSFGAGVYDVMFYNVFDLDDAMDAWFYSDFDERELSLNFSYYDDEDEDYDTSDTDLVMNEDCYIAGGYTLTDLGGMEADIITNDDDEIIYIKIVSTVEYSDDVDGTISGDSLEVDGDSVDSIADYTYWYDGNYEFAPSGYAKVFYNEDGDVYAVSDLQGPGFMPYDDWSEVIIADSYDEDDETLDTLIGDAVDLEDQDYVVFKDGEEIDVAAIEQMDLVYVFYLGASDVDVVLLVGDYVEGTLTEGEDYFITVGDNDYNFYYYCDSWYNTEGGVDGDYNDLDEINDLDDVFDADVQLGLYRNPFEVAYLISDVDASSSTVYGIVTDITISGLFDNITDVTILNQDGDEVTYDLDDDDIFYYEEDGADAGTKEIDLGSYVEVKLDEDGVITSAEDIISVVEMGDVEEDIMEVSGSKIKIDGTWYKVTDDTLFFETVSTDTFDYGYDTYDSSYFDEANLISVDDVLDADDIYVVVTEIASNDGGTLERLYMLDSDVTASAEGYSFVDRLYTNSSGDFVEMLDGTVAEQSSDDYIYDVLYAYQIVSDELEVTPLVAVDIVATTLVPSTFESSTAETYGEPFEDGFWITNTGEMATSGVIYTLDDLDIDVYDVDGDTITLVTGDYYTITDDTMVYTLDDDYDVSLGDEDDIEDDSCILAISDEDANLLYVFVMSD